MRVKSRGEIKRRKVEQGTRSWTVDDGLFGPYVSERWDELLIDLYPTTPAPFPVPDKPYGFCGRKAPRKKEADVLMSR